MSLPKKTKDREVPVHQRKTWKERHFLLWQIEQARSRPRLGWRIVISRRLVRLATDRNLLKRRIREALRQRKAQPPPGKLWVLKLRSGGRLPKYGEMADEISLLLKQAGVQ